MSVLVWEKPKKLRDSKEHADSYSADGAPPGAYVPNMSAEDRLKWKAKLVGHKTGYPQVEIRRDGCVIIVSTRGYKYKHYDTRDIRQWKKASKPAEDVKLIHIACSGPMYLTEREYAEMLEAVREAKAKLEEIG